MSLINQRNATKGLLIVVAAIIIFWRVLFRKVLAAHVTVSWSYDYGLVPCLNRIALSTLAWRCCPNLARVFNKRTIIHSAPCTQF